MSWRRPRPEAAAPLADAMLLLRPPVELALTAALRRVARRRPEVFERLGEAGDVSFVIEPTDFPVGFRLTPSGRRGRVVVVRKGDPAPAAARISGPLATLLALFDGSGDADSAFFSRQIRVEGDTGAVVALHNTLEAAELTVADIVGAPAALHPAVNGLAGRLRQAISPARAQAHAH